MCVNSVLVCVCVAVPSVLTSNAGSRFVGFNMFVCMLGAVAIESQDARVERSSDRRSWRFTFAVALI